MTIFEPKFKNIKEENDDKINYINKIDTYIYRRTHKSNRNIYFLIQKIKRIIMKQI